MLHKLAMIINALLESVFAASDRLWLISCLLSFLTAAMAFVLMLYILERIYLKLAK